MRKMCGLKAFQLRKVSLWIYRLVVSSSCSCSHGNCQVDFLLLARKLEMLSRLEPFNSMKLKWNSLHRSCHLAQVVYSYRGEKSIYSNQICKFYLIGIILKGGVSLSVCVRCEKITSCFKNQTSTITTTKILAQHVKNWQYFRQENNIPETQSRPYKEKRTSGYLQPSNI